MLDSKLYQVEHHCCKFTSSWLHRVLCVGCQITKEDLWRKWPYEKQEVGSYLRFSFFWIRLPTNAVCFVSLPHPRLHTQHCYSVQASCSWNKVKQNALKKKKSGFCILSSELQTVLTYFHCGLFCGSIHVWRNDKWKPPSIRTQPQHQTPWGKSPGCQRHLQQGTEKCSWESYVAWDISIAFNHDLYHCCIFIFMYILCNCHTPKILT